MTSPAAARTEPDAYSVLAPVYDLLTGGYAYDRWVASLLELAARHGLTERRALDVACGTGRSFIPLIERGYEVVGCDSSPEMLLKAAESAAGRAALHLADMRALPSFGSFPLVTCLDDAVNHLDSERDLLAALEGMRSNLSRGGLLIFDVNLLSAYADVPGTVLQDDGRLVCWSSSGKLIARSGGAAEVVIDVFTRAAGDLWRHSRAVQRHRHFALSTVKQATARAGLELLAVHGQRPGAFLDPHVDEAVHHKAVLIARPRLLPATNGRRAHALGPVT
jgi:SAM-dependent methyltransferase